MPFGAVFTTSDLGGGRIYTRLRGPLLLGYSTQDPGGQTMGITSTAPAGSAAQPMYSYFPRPDMGYYAANVTTSAPDQRFSQSGVDYISWTSVGMRLVSTAAAVPDLAWVNGPLTTAAVQGFLYCPGTSQTPVGAGPVTPFVSGTSGSNITYAVPMVFDVTNKKLWMYTTASSWIGLGGSTSGATLWTTSS